MDRRLAWSGDESRRGLTRAELSGGNVVAGRERGLEFDDNCILGLVDEEEPKPNTEEIPSHVKPPDLRGPLTAAFGPTEEADEGVGASPVDVGTTVFGVKGSCVEAPGPGEDLLKKLVETGLGFVASTGASTVRASDRAGVGEALLSAFGVALFVR